MGLPYVLNLDVVNKIIFCIEIFSLIDLVLFLDLIGLLQSTGQLVEDITSFNKVLGELIIGFRNVAFLPSEASFYETFLKNSSRGKVFGTAICLKTLVAVSKGMLPVKSFHPN